MKKLVLFLALVFVSTSLLAIMDGDFIKTNEGVFFFKKVKKGMVENFTGIKSNGEKVKFTKDEVIGYSISGEEYEKVPVYIDNIAIGKSDFMKVVCYRNQMKLYEYEYYGGNNFKESRRYYVFKGDKFVVEMDYVNRPNLTAFFDAN